MFQKVETWVDLVELEHDMLKLWKETKAFDKLRKKNAGNEPWSFLDGPITANNPMGVHHAWGRTLKDVYQRFHAMHGHDLRYQNGFDCQGLWVEVEVEKELGFQTKRDIEEYGVENFITRCKERVKKYSAIQTDQSIRLGYWMDWNDSYYTMSDENNFTIWSFLKKCHERGFIYRGHDVMPWCPRCGVGLSQHEMQEGYKEVAHTSVIVRFPLRDRQGEALLAWTTTPWTLTSNVAAAVHPDLPYAKVKCEEGIVWLANALCGKVFGKKPHEILETRPGKDLVGWTYDGPFDELPAQKKAREQHRVIPWDEVSEGDGTGIVHIAPGCGAEDFGLGKEHGLEALCPIDETGHFGDAFGPYAGKSAYDMAEPVMESLTAKKILFGHEDYVHNYPHCWRCSAQLLFRKDYFWFIAMDAWRQEIMDVARQINWIPSYGKDLELDWLKNMRDWMISKKRYWGLALPIWTCDDPKCDWFDVIGGRDELEKRATEGFTEFDGHSPHRPWIDGIKICCEKCGATASRTLDVGNPWLDAGIVPYSTMRYNTDKAYWEKWFPANLVLECFPGQFRNWFYALLAMSTMMENRPPFETLLGHALVRDEHGNEMHKSTGNAIWFDEAVEKMGADVMRWVYCSQDTTSNLNFGYGPGREVRGKVVNTFWNTYAFFCNYARLAEWTPTDEEIPFEDRPEMDRWILSHLQSLVERCEKSYREFKVQHVTRAAASFLEKLSNWYVRQNRRRFWKNATEGDSAMAFDTLYRCLHSLNRVVAPIVPFMSEAIYQNMVRSWNESAPESVHHSDFPAVRSDWLDEKLLKDMDAAQRLTWLGLSARESGGVKVRQPLPTFIVRPADETERSGALRFADLLKETLNVKELRVLAEGEELPVESFCKPQFRALGPAFGKDSKVAAEAIKALDGARASAAQAAGESLVVTVNGADLEIGPDMYVVEQRRPEGLAMAQDEETVVAVDTQIDEELAQEGLMRDLLRRLQNVRKDVGLEMEDRIHLEFHSESEALSTMLKRWQAHVAEELLCTRWEKAAAAGEDWIAVNCGAHEAHVRIVKA